MRKSGMNLPCMQGLGAPHAIAPPGEEEPRPMPRAKGGWAPPDSPPGEPATPTPHGRRVSPRTRRPCVEAEWVLRLGPPPGGRYAAPTACDGPPSPRTDPTHSALELPHLQPSTSPRSSMTTGPNSPATRSPRRGGRTDAEGRPPEGRRIRCGRMHRLMPSPPGQRSAHARSTPAPATPPSPRPPPGAREADDPGSAAPARGRSWPA